VDGRLQLTICFGVLRIATPVEADRRAYDPILEIEAQELATLVLDPVPRVPGRRHFGKNVRGRQERESRRSHAPIGPSSNVVPDAAPLRWHIQALQIS
jgi:hypothetical protein